jgi:hypothetical protein
MHRDLLSLFNDGKNCQSELQDLGNKFTSQSIDSIILKESKCKKEKVRVCADSRLRKS